MKVLLNRFHLNGDKLGFHPQTQNLQPYLLTQVLTLGVTGLKRYVGAESLCIEQRKVILVVYKREGLD